MTPFLHGLVRLPFVIFVTFFSQQAARARRPDPNGRTRGRRTVSRAAHRRSLFP
jgi:hypothetical protein